MSSESFLIAFLLVYPTLVWADVAPWSKSRNTSFGFRSSGSRLSSVLPSLCKVRKTASLTKSHFLTWEIANKKTVLLHRAFEGVGWDKAIDDICSFTRNLQLRKFRHNERQSQN